MSLVARAEQTHSRARRLQAGASAMHDERQGFEEEIDMQLDTRDMTEKGSGTASIMYCEVKIGSLAAQHAGQTRTAAIEAELRLETA
jgi:hypothetical protein